MSCPYYTFKDGDYHCVKQGKDVNSDIYWKYCRNYDYDDCPIYKNESSSSGGCFLTSACTAARGLPDDCYELQTLRSFRDNWLSKAEGGSAAIAHYYIVAPKIVEAIDKQPNSNEIYEKIYSDMIAPCIRFIEEQKFQEALALYKSMTLQLAKGYC